MELKHRWNETQQNIITSLIKVMQSRRFNIPPETVFTVQNILKKRNVEFYEAWGEFNAIFNEFSWDSFWQICLCQGAGGVLCGGVPESYSGKKDSFKFFKNKFFGSRRKPTFQPLPVRIPDRELFDNATAGNLPKTILLYDMANTPGAKLKNIYHAMLNKYEYEKVMFLNERYGGLENICLDTLEYHFLAGDWKEGKEKFNHFFSVQFGTSNSNIWGKMCSYGTLDKQIKSMLDIGINPDLPALISDCSRWQKISLRQLLYFVDEVCEAYRYLKINTEFDMLCNAAEIFVKWEKEHESMA